LKQILFIFTFIFSSQAFAEGGDLINGYLKDRSHAFLTVISYSLTPDVTTGSLSLSDGVLKNPSLSMTSLGGGGVLSDEFPLYFEGTIALNRYNPEFITNDQNHINLPVSWNSISGTGGLGWDFKLSDYWKFRPIANFTLGHVESDLSVLGRVLDHKYDVDLDFLNHGRLNAYGLGGSLMMIYQDFTPEYENEIEVRYTNIQLTSFDSSKVVQGSTDAQSLGLWSRRRVPTGFTILGNQIRSVLEFAHTQYLADSRGALGFDYLSSIGAGLELDLKNYGIFVTRARVVARYQFAPDITGYSIGVAVSF
jgi:hypothetical protein